MSPTHLEDIPNPASKKQRIVKVDQSVEEVTDGQATTADLTWLQKRISFVTPLLMLSTFLVLF